MTGPKLSYIVQWGDARHERSDKRYWTKPKALASRASALDAIERQVEHFRDRDAQMAESSPWLANARLSLAEARSMRWGPGSTFVLEVMWRGLPWMAVMDVKPRG